MSFRIVEPVVENPLTLSKNASVKSGIYPPIQNGIIPKRLVKIHARATTTKVVRIFNKILRLLKIKAPIPNRIQLEIIGIAKEGRASISPQKKAVARGISIVEPTIAIRAEIILNKSTTIILFVYVSK